MNLIDRAGELGGRIALAVAVTLAFEVAGRLLTPLVAAIREALTDADGVLGEPPPDAVVGDVVDGELAFVRS